MSSPPRRIAFGITELDPGGAERMLTELVTRLDRLEWEPRVYCLGPEAHYAEVLRNQGVPVTCFGANGMQSAPRVLWQWTQALRKFRPHILYTWLFHANLLGRFAGRWAGVPHVISGIRVAEKRSPWHGRLDRWTNRLVERNVCVSRGVADFMEQTVGLDPRKTVVIPNAVDTQRFTNIVPADLTVWGIPIGSRVFITVGRLEPQKGIDVLLAALPILFSQATDMHLLIVGHGPDRPRLEQQAQTLGISDRVHWAGQQAEIPSLLAACTALVLPSRWEGMPNVVLEAMAAGKPILASNVEGVAELVQPGTNGWLFPPDQPQILAETLTHFLYDSTATSRMGRESQSIISERFTIDIYVSNHIKMFRNLD